MRSVPQLFVNYVASPRRETGFNAGFARFVLGVTAAWRVMTSANWGTLHEWPVRTNEYNTFLIPFDGYLRYLPVEVAVTTFFLLLFAVGYRTPVTGFLGALLLGHVSGVLNVIVPLHSSTFMSAFVVLVLVFAIFDRSEALSVDGLRRAYRQPLPVLNTRLQNQNDDSQELYVLKVALAVFGFFLFMTGFSKAFYGPAPEWTRNLPLLIHHYQISHIPSDAPIRLAVGNLLIENPRLGVLSGWATLAIEMGFLVVVLFRAKLTLPFVVIFGFLVTIAVSMDPFFLEMFIVPSLFVPWDEAWRRLQRDERLDVVYDDRQFRCAWALQPIETFDLDRRIGLFPHSDVPGRYADRNVVSGTTLCVFEPDGSATGGYDAYRRLLAHFPPLRPLAALLGVGPVAATGKRLYRWMPTDRDRRPPYSVDDRR